MKTLLASLRYPLIQAPMAGVQNAALTIAASRAGGLGSLPAAMLDSGQLAAELDKIQTALHLQNLPYNVNFFAHRTPEISEAAQQEWLAVLRPYFKALGIENPQLPAATRRPFDEQALAVLEQYRPPIVSFHFGLPSPELLSAVKATGAKILSSATTVAEARWLEANGADGIIAQGWEAGGHRGWFLDRNIQNQSGTFSLLPRIKAAVRLPVIAAGGISSRETVRAAFSLGADAVQAGTAFLLADEAATSPAHRAALQSPAAEHTHVTNLFSGGAARGIPNRLMNELGALHPKAPPFPAASAAAGLLRNAAEQQDCYDFTPFWAGQNAPLAQSGSAQIIIQHLMQE